MIVLVTGGAGFIGKHLTAALRARGHDVRILDSLRPDVHPPGAAHDSEIVVGDIRDTSAVSSVLDGVDVVCHLAAKVGLGVDVQDLPDYASSNDHGTAVLLAAMARAGIARLVLASSMVVYGEGLGRCVDHGLVRPGPRHEQDLAAGRFEPPCPLCGSQLLPALVGEDCPADPRNGYAASKVAQEHLSRSWALATESAVTALRFHNVYGPGMPRDTPYAGVAAIFESALRAGNPPQVYEDGAQRRDFVHVRDVASATVAAAERSWDLPRADRLRAFNVGSGTPRTVGELAAALSTALAGPTPVITSRYRAGDVRHITADSSRLRDELEWSPGVAFEAGVAELVRS